MDPDRDRTHLSIKKSYIAVIILILIGVMAGWWLGHTRNNPAAASDQTTASPSSSGTNERDVKALVRYTLPDGWKDGSCPSATGTVFLVPNDADGIDCSANPSAPIKLSVDGGNNTDCNQLQNVQNVSKHICISEFINGHKSLKAETVYNQDSAYHKPTAINAYYIDTGSSVVKVEYIHDPSTSEYLTGWEQLAKSIQTKS